MEASKVYYTDFRCPVGTSLLEKLRRVCIAAGIKDIDMDGRFVAIKMHFGEPGNLAFLRPNWARTVADFVKERGGKPFRRKKIFNFMIQYLCPIFAAIILISSVANALGWIAM